MSFTITSTGALEILDSRSRPTVEVTVEFADGTIGVAGVPSGASTGSGEAVERRDGDPHRHQGAGVLGAVAAVNDEINVTLSGRQFTTLAELDAVLIDLDGTDNKARLGANAIVGVSMAAARASRSPTARSCISRWLPRASNHGYLCRISTSSTVALTPRTRSSSRSS